MLNSQQQKIPFNPNALANFSNSIPMENCENVFKFHFVESIEIISIPEKILTRGAANSFFINTKSIKEN